MHYILNVLHSGLIRLAVGLFGGLIFEEGERAPQDEMELKFEAITHMDNDERHVVLSVLDSMIIKHQTKRFFIPQSGTS